MEKPGKTGKVREKSTGTCLPLKNRFQKNTVACRGRAGGVRAGLYGTFLYALCATNRNEQMREPVYEKKYHEDAGIPPR